MRDDVLVCPLQGIADVDRDRFGSNATPFMRPDCVVPAGEAASCPASPTQPRPEWSAGASVSLPSMSQRPGPGRQRMDKMLGVLLADPGRSSGRSSEQVLQLTIAGIRDQGALERAVDLLVIGNLVLGIGLVEGSPLRAR